MGLMDLFQNMQNGGLLGGEHGGGLLGNLQNGGGLMGSYISKLKESVNRAESRPKPGPLCNTQCEIDDSRCEACLAEQQAILDAFGEVQKLEQAINDFNNNPAAAAVPEKKPTKCSLCGAPLEQGLRECPYCDTPYPSGALSTSSPGDLPTNKIEQDNLILEKVTSAWALYAALYKKQMENNTESKKSQLPAFLRGVMGASSSKLSEYMVMTSAEIRQSAIENNVSYYDYAVGVMQGRYQSAKFIALEKADAMREKLFQERKKYYERSREIFERGEEIKRERRQRDYEFRRDLERSADAARLSNSLDRLSDKLR